MHARWSGTSAACSPSHLGGAAGNRPRHVLGQGRGRGGRRRTLKRGGWPPEKQWRASLLSICVRSTPSAWPGRCTAWCSRVRTARRCGLPSSGPTHGQPKRLRATARARWALQPKDWLRLQLTGEPCGEPTDASATLLYDFVDDGWAYRALEELDIRADLFPDLVASQGVAGRLTREAAMELGINAGIPVAAGAADTAATLVGHGVLAPGPVVLTIGTGAQMTTVRQEFKADPAQRTYVFRTVQNGKWYSMAAILNAGLALDWVGRLFGVDSEELHGSAARIPAGSGGVSFFPYLVAERTTHVDAGACWSGVGLQHRKEHLLKASLEGVAFALHDAMEALEATGISPADLQLAGGGTVNQHWRQMLADVLGRRMLAIDSPAGSARGAALLGGLAAGKFKTLEDVAALAMGADLAAEPGAAADEYSRLYERWKKMSRSLGPPPIETPKPSSPTSTVDRRPPARR